MKFIQELIFSDVRHLDTTPALYSTEHKLSILRFPLIAYR